MLNLTKSPKNLSGFQYLMQGCKLITRPGIKRFVLLPLLANILFLGGSFWWLYQKLENWIHWIVSKTPDWMQWLSYILWPLAVISVLLIFTYFFSTIANFIAAPFNGLLAEKLEADLTGTPAPDTGVIALFKDVPRVLKRELAKLCYYIPRALVLLLLYFIPVIGQTVAPVLWFIFSAWMLSIQYCDYPFDNHKVSFPTMRNALRQNKIINLQFGATVSILTMIPIVNLVIMPIAVCAATAMWVDHYRDQHVPRIMP
ncbi:sulfate transporter [Photorhabdus luminescens subsp. luminescens]|uniref:Sulfate transporter CysZ n=1 Tax=Photorhabdus luminescens TaxID=29488 RepID=A0A1G5R3G2_PHOLU|nr:sulfate transporter CysZ [Photorhabdus luminescens]KMW72861.1 sulfate transporter [Photorhabdus luminescens subsp. luminescens]SCZ68603.1 CysZ protein [Photorhabdus luminescens]